MSSPRASELISLGSATLGECGATPMQPRIKPAWPGARLAAPAFTVSLAPGDNLAIHVAVVRAPAGSALVVETSEPRELGYWGEVLTTAAEARHIAGLVIDGGVRDVGALRAHGFPVFSSSVALPGAVKRKGGATGVTVSVGGAQASTGDWVVGDDDGVVVVPAGSLGQVVADSGARAAREHGFFEALRAGSTTIELLGLDPSSVRDGER